jgi:hypothetical protein
LYVSERIASYALGNFEHAKELARRNAHALGWHPSGINEESVRYFSSLKEEKEMVDCVLRYVREKYKKNFYDNIEAFREAWEPEWYKKFNQTKGNGPSANNRKNEVNLDSYVRESILEIYRQLPAPIPTINEEKFKKSLSDSKTILITLRIEDKSGRIVGYVKGGPLESHPLRRGTYDANLGKKNAQMEWINIKPGYWGETGSHLLRSQFLKEAKRRGYSFVTSYVHRNVIISRKNRGEAIEIVQRCDPDKLDCYRVDLRKLDLL